MAIATRDEATATTGTLMGDGVVNGRRLGTRLHAVKWQLDHTSGKEKKERTQGPGGERAKKDGKGLAWSGLVESGQAPACWVRLRDWET